MSDVALWWYRRPGGKINFGDELGKEIIERLGYRVRQVELREAELVACGSILHAAFPAHTAVWGSGLMSPAKRPRQPLTNVLALRGELTRRYLAQPLPDDLPLGDPGLLAPLLWEPSPVKKYQLGVVPHYVDTRSWPMADVVIDVGQPVSDTIEQITSCSMIASSSLHGLIVAQAYGIPAMRLPHPKVGGADFKWMDYTTALARPLEQTQQDLLRALPL